MIINASIEVRMTSSRLPGKVLKVIQGKSVLELLIERVKKSSYINTVIVATTTNVDDDPVEELCKKLKVECFRGSEPDVLGRVYESHKAYNSDVVIELTGDNPLIDWRLIDHCLLSYLHSDADYVSSILEPFFPYGQAVQVFSFKLLQFLNDNALTKYDREHVTPYIYQNDGKYKILKIAGSKEQYAPDMRHTLDTKEDFVTIEAVFNKLYPTDRSFTMEDAISACKEIA